MKRIILALILLAGLAGTAQAASTAKQIDFLLAGYRHPTSDEVLSGGKIKTFLTGTSTLSSLWTDQAKGGDASNPVILDSSGKAEVYGDALYKFEIYDSNDVLLETVSGLEYESISIVDPIDSIADLRSTDETLLVSDVVAFVSGYYNPGDGGGGHFYWDSVSTETDNGGTIIKVTSVATGRWKRIFGGAIDVKWFGAKGNGATDDLAFIQNAIDFIGAAGGGLLVFPDGVYLVSAAIDLDDAINTTIKGLTTIVWGNVQHGAVIQATTLGTNIFDFSPIGSRIESRVTLQDLYLDGDDKAEDLIRFDNFATANFTRVTTVDATRYGINLGDTNLSYGAEIDTCYFNGNDTAGLRNNSNNTFLRFSRVDAGIYAVDIAVAGGDSEIIGCHLESGASATLRMTAVGNNRIVGNVLTTPFVTNTVIEIIGGGAANNVITGNLIIGDSSAGSIGIDMDGSGHVITGNVIAGFEDAIILRTNNMTITGNTIDATQFALSELTPGGSNTITGNNIESGTANIVNDETILMNNKGFDDQEPVNTDTLSAGDNNDYAINSVNVKTLFITADVAGSALTGIAGGVRGKRLRITHLSANTFTIEHEDAGSTASNRIVSKTSAAVTLVQNETVDLEYNSDAARWFLGN